MVREEADAKLERNQVDAVEEMAVVGLAEEVLRMRLISPVDHAEKLEVEDHGAKLGGVFTRRIAHGAHGVTDVIMDQAGLHGIEVDDARPAPGRLVDHDVADLRVAVRGA